MCDLPSNNLKSWFNGIPQNRCSSVHKPLWLSSFLREDFVTRPRKFSLSARYQRAAGGIWKQLWRWMKSMLFSISKPLWFCLLLYWWWKGPSRKDEAFHIEIAVQEEVIWRLCHLLLIFSQRIVYHKLHKRTQFGGRIQCLTVPKPVPLSKFIWYPTKPN